MNSIIKKDGYDFSFNPSACNTCNGNCCIGESGYIWINNSEIKTLASHLNLTIEEAKNRFLYKIGYKFSIREIKLSNNNFACCFFNLEKKQCSIYEARPSQCRSFPFWEYFKKNEQEVFKECPAVKKL